MILRRFLMVLAVLNVAGCERGPQEPPPVTPQTEAAVDEAVPGAAPTATPGSPDGAAAPVEPALVAQALVLGEWQRADNRPTCAPVAFLSTGQARGAPRPAEFGGGWGVAFDLPNLRSAYGLAGPGPIAADSLPPDDQRERLGAQWPYFRELAALPPPAFAGYGVEGAETYPPGNPSGRGLNSLAYVRVGEQRCTYNVWSRLGRSHLELLLDALRPVRVD
jgi:hypothetical protein